LLAHRYVQGEIMGEAFVFIIIAIFTGILGLVIGGPFRILVIENEIFESVFFRAIFGIIFFPAVVGVILLVLCPSGKRACPNFMRRSSIDRKKWRLIDVTRKHTGFTIPP
jgi:hypothetical protein